MSTYDDTALAVRFRALATEPLPASWDEVLARARGDRRRLPTSLRSSRSRVAVVIAVALIGVVGAASASGTVRGLLPIVGKGEPGYSREATCNGMRGNFKLRYSWRDQSGAPLLRWMIVPGSGQYAEVTGGGGFDFELVTRQGSKLWIGHLRGTITSGGTKQPVLITLVGSGFDYTPPGRINPRRFLMRPLERGPLKPDSGSQHTIGAG